MRISDERIRELEVISSEIKKDIVRMIGIARSGSLEIPITVPEVFVFLYWEVLENTIGYKTKFFLGIPECTPVLYAVLSKKGYFGREELWHFRRLGSILPALPDFRRTPGVDSPCVIGGIELSIAAANALVDIERNNCSISICLSSTKIFDDDDFLEESLYAVRTGLGNLIQIFLLFTTDNVIPNTVENCSNKLSKMGWNVCFANGSNYRDMSQIFCGYDYSDTRPKALFLIIGQDNDLIHAKTKTAGILSSMNSEEMDIALEELEGQQ